MQMRKLALVMASVAGLGFAAPAVAMDNSASQDRIQLAQADFSVRIGDRNRDRVRERTVIRTDRDRGYHRGWRSRAHSDNVVIVKKRKPARKTVIIER
jgi:hypothetical protein